MATSLKQIAQMYGMVDYYDMHTGCTYHLSKAIGGTKGKLNVPVTCDGHLIGYARMERS